MEWLTDELLFYGGIAVAGSSLVSGIIFLCVSKMRKVCLDARLEEEYGKRRSDRHFPQK